MRQNVPAVSRSQSFLDSRAMFQNPVRVLTKYIELLRHTADRGGSAVPLTNRTGYNFMT